MTTAGHDAATNDEAFAAALSTAVAMRHQPGALWVLTLVLVAMSGRDRAEKAYATAVAALPLCRGRVSLLDMFSAPAVPYWQAGQALLAKLSASHRQSARGGCDCVATAVAAAVAAIAAERRTSAATIHLLMNSAVMAVAQARAAGQSDDTLIGWLAERAQRNG